MMFLYLKGSILVSPGFQNSSNLHKLSGELSQKATCDIIAHIWPICVYRTWIEVSGLKESSKENSCACNFANSSNLMQILKNPTLLSAMITKRTPQNPEGTGI